MHDSVRHKLEGKWLRLHPCRGRVLTRHWIRVLTKSLSGCVLSHAIATSALYATGMVLDELAGGLGLVWRPWLGPVGCVSAVAGAFIALAAVPHVSRAPWHGAIAGLAGSGWALLMASVLNWWPCTSLLACAWVLACSIAYGMALAVGPSTHEQRLFGFATAEPNRESDRSAESATAA